MHKQKTALTIVLLRLHQLTIMLTENNQAFSGRLNTLVSAGESWSTEIFPHGTVGSINSCYSCDDISVALHIVFNLKYEAHLCYQPHYMNPLSLCLTSTLRARYTPTY